MDDNDRTMMPTARRGPVAESGSTLAMPRNNPQPDETQHGDSLPQGQRLQEFEIQSRLGQGGFSIVYRAWDHALKRAVALKEYLPDGIARRLPDGQVVAQSERHRETFEIGLRSFVEEGVTLANFDHPALVRVYRNFEANGTAYMVMQLVQGRTLEEAAKAAQGAEPPNEEWLMALLDPLTAALQIVHAEGIVHRDIAPDNVMILEGTQRPLLLDFGAARRVIGDQAQNPTAMLKPSYAPIEQYPESGFMQGAYTDVYALAGVVHRLLTGTAPPNSQARALKDSYKPLALRLKGRYSARLLAAIDHSLALKPESRPPTIEAFRKELGLDTQQAAGPAKPQPQARPPGDHRRVLIPALAAGALILVIGSGLYFWMSSAPAPAGVSGASGTPAQAAAVDQAPVPTASQPAPAVATAGLDPEQAFASVLQAASPEIQVSLAVEKPQLKLKETPLRLRLKSSQPGYFYVLLHDIDHEARLLFPNKYSEQNRIAAGATVVLPGASTDPETGLEQVAEIVYVTAGQGRLMAIVSPTPLDLDAVTKAPDGSYRLLLKGAEAAQLQAQQASQGSSRPLYAGRPICGAKKPCDERFGATEAGFTIGP